MMKRSDRIISEYKAGLWLLACEICYWMAPASVAEQVLHVHHIVPLHCSGTDALDNLILVCPNHHSLIHARFPTHEHRYWGPTERTVLIAMMRRFEADEEGSFRDEMIAAADALEKFREKT